MTEFAALPASHVTMPRRIALIGNFVPRQCGLATFTTDTYRALRERFPEMAVDVYAMSDPGFDHVYPPEVTAVVDRDNLSSYVAIARAIEASGAEAIWLQHEYGIYGGSAGDHILTLLDRVTAPLIVTLHTVLEKPNAEERRVLEALLQKASRIIVMAEKGKEILARVYGARTDIIAVIPHGIPDRPFRAPDEMKERFGFKGRKVILTFGLLSPNKGIETIIAAMPTIAATHPESLYVVLGATHPHLIAHEGERYRESLQDLSKSLGVEDHVTFINAFVGSEELLDYLEAADIYVTPYLNPAQITSGTLAYAVGLGKPVVSTPYVHAKEMLADGHGVLVDFGNSDGFASAIIGLLDDDAMREALRQRSYALGRTMIWPRLAEAAMDQIGQMIAARPARLAKPRRRSLKLLQPDFRGVERMSDATGMLQHSIFSVPDRHHGYCVDDNARALILVTQMDNLDHDVRDRWTTVYASFLQQAWNPEKCRFRNFMSYDRKWLEEVGSDDSFGRALWALGVTARDAHKPDHRRWARVMFDQTANHALELDSPRSWAFTMLGASAALKAHPGHALPERVLETFGERLLSLVSASRRPDWVWFEIVLAYDNARLPEALIRAGTALERADFIDCGLETLAWIISHQTAEEGHFRAVGTESFGRALEPPLPFDQQPLEAQAVIDACEAAWEASGDPMWLEEASRAYHWYLGHNDMDAALATAANGGCYDGLMPTGINLNQGAESILALQLSSCAMARLSRHSADKPNWAVAAE